MKIVKINVDGEMKIDSIYDTDNKTSQTINRAFKVPAGNYKNIILDFNFISPSANQDGLKLFAIFKTEYIEKPIEVEITDIEAEGETYTTSCFVPSEVLQKDGKVTLGIYGYILNEDETLKKRVSLSPISHDVITGSYEENTVDPIVPTPTVFEVYFDKISDAYNLYKNDLNKAKTELKSDINAGDENLQTQLNTEITNRISADNNLQNQITNGLSNISNGTPLIASSVSGMTDISRIYVNTTDGHKYYYNGSSWVDFGVYQAIEIADNSIETSMLKDNSVTKSKLESPIQELIENDTKELAFIKQTTKYFNTTTHELTTTSRMSATLINVKPYEKYLITVSCDINVNTVCAVMFFDENNEYISHEYTRTYDFVDKEIIIPENAYYMGVSGLTLQPFIIKKVKYKIKEENEELTLNNISKHILNNENYKIALVGDSITAGVGGTGYSATGETIISISDKTYKRNEVGYCWANLLKKYLEFKFENVSVVNNGISGMKSNLVASTDYERLPYLVGDANLVICMLGTNDRADETPQSTYDNLVPLINYCKSNNKDIIFMCPIPGSIDQDSGKDYHFEDLSNTIKRLCDNYKIPFIDLFTLFKDYCYENNLSMDDLRVDSLHPNDSGYKIMFKLIIKQLGISIPRDDATWFDFNSI